MVYVLESRGDLYLLIIIGLLISARFVKFGTRLSVSGHLGNRGFQSRVSLREL